MHAAVYYMNMLLKLLDLSFVSITMSLLSILVTDVHNSGEGYGTTLDTNLKVHAYVPDRQGMIVNTSHLSAVKQQTHNEVHWR